ncbi:hypothetical protein POM88_037399 [Heracleum sosnowskyi]|uniref:RNase H type-1 domain-containing protein n=1 Tax=Heracleum sosnowskyi TaxID=360622 RepID=A0AAD8HRY1_9APIA|nr:hypothetical protein POM88_037399 [Heracleum sosnowskyi]
MNQPPLPAVRWRMPDFGVVKVNVNGFFTEDPFPNGNVSGVGVVIHDHRGKIVSMFAGSLGIENQRVNEHYAMFEGLVRAYWEREDVVELEADNVAAYWEWTNSMVHGVLDECQFIVQQLNQREADGNLVLTKRPIDEDSNALARYLARHGAENWKSMICNEEPFGRISELWSLDMGLGLIGGLFQIVLQNDLIPEEW